MMDEIAVTNVFAQKMANKNGAKIYNLRGKWVIENNYFSFLRLSPSGALTMHASQAATFDSEISAAKFYFEWRKKVKADTGHQYSEESK